jgi:hypothetical protein
MLMKMQSAPIRPTIDDKTRKYEDTTENPSLGSIAIADSVFRQRLCSSRDRPKGRRPSSRESCGVHAN